MVKRKISEHISVDWGSNNPEWRRIRTSPGIVSDLHRRGNQWVKRLNEDLERAEARRGQEVEAGYDYTVTTRGTRARLYVNTTDARAAAHEARHQNLLKMAVIGESAHSGDPVDPNLPEELAKRVKKRSAVHKRKQKAKAKKWLKAEQAHIDAHGSPPHNLDNP